MQLEKMKSHHKLSKTGSIHGVKLIVELLVIWMKNQDKCIKDVLLQIQLGFFSVGPGFRL